MGHDNPHNNLFKTFLFPKVFKNDMEINFEGQNFVTMESILNIVGKTGNFEEVTV